MKQSYIKHSGKSLSHHPGKVIAVSCLSAFSIFIVGLFVMRSDTNSEAVEVEPVTPAVVINTRPEPESFPRNTFMPNLQEGIASDSIDLNTFSPGRDLIYVTDERVWWESDNDSNDTEDDHSMHRAIEAPFRRLIDLVCDNGGTLEVHDAYRPEGIHNRKSLHKEGRALDLTCDQFPMEKLAKLCWVAGFDWVYYEHKKAPHIHVSVKRERDNLQ